MGSPDMEFVDSSNIEQIGYSPEDQELHVRFKSGELYVYAGVPEAIYAELMAADSKGSYLNRTVKGNFDARKD
jgi:hypothetical protein